MLSRAIGEFGKENQFCFTSGARAYFGMVGAAYGDYKGFRVVLIHDARELHQVLRIHIALADCEDFNDRVGNVIPLIKEEKQVRDAYLCDHMLCILMWRKLGAVKTDELENALVSAIKALKKQKLHPGCSVCGAAGGDYVGHADVPYLACYDHAGDLSELHLLSTDRREKMPSHSLLGAIGSVFCSVPGILLWMGIFLFLQKIAAVAGYVIFYGTFKGYQLFKGKLSRLSALWMLLWSFIATIGAEFLSMLVVDIRAAGTFGAGVDLAHVISETLSAGSLSDIFWGLAFILAGWCVHLLGMFRKPKNSIGFRELEG